MFDVLKTLGLDAQDLVWQDLSICDQMPTNNFYDDYESSPRLAAAVDQACLSCPVMKQCFTAGILGGEYGTWGGVYLVSGKPDKGRNSHKTPAIKTQIKERLGAINLDI